MISQQTIIGSARMLLDRIVFACTVAFALVWVTGSDNVAEEQLYNAELIWNNGDKVPGSVISADESRLQWQAPTLFRDPLNLDLGFLNQITFEPDPARAKTGETYAVQMTAGDSLFGEINKLDEDFLYLSSIRFGAIKIDRTSIATILNLKTSGSLLNGRFDLNNWDAKRGEKKYWQVNGQGHLQSQRNNIHLFLKSELPDSALIEFEIEWKKKLDFIFGFGVPRDSRKIETLPRLESWDDSIVLSHNDDFEVVIESNDHSAKRLRLLIHWDRTIHQIVIYDEKGQSLATAKIGAPAGGTEPGVFLENKSGDLTVTNIMIRRSSAGFNATEPSIQTIDQPAINGKLISFDGVSWQIAQSDKESGAGRDDSTAISADKFCGAFLINEVIKKGHYQTKLTYQDGLHVSGKFVSIQQDAVSLLSEYCADPIVLNLTGAAKLVFAKPRSKSKAQKFWHTLYNKAGSIKGRLEAGSGSSDDILRWRVAGADIAVPFSQGDARIVLQRKKPIVAVDREWADTLYMANRDTIPCRIVSINPANVTIESFTENKVIPQDKIKAIDFRTQSVGETISPTDDDWVIPAASRKRVKTSQEKLMAKVDAEFGHPWLFSAGSFEFDLEWKEAYGVLECRVLVGDLASGDGGKKVNIMMYGTNLLVTESGVMDVRNQKMVAINNSKAKIKFSLERGELIVSINGKPAYKDSASTNSNRGRGVMFKLIDTYQQRISCSLSNLKLNYSESGNGSLVDPERKALLLTIPRLKKMNPPKQILCASNADMLRGELISMDEEFLNFRSNNEVQKFPRSIVSNIVWLHAEQLGKSTSAGQPATDIAAEIHPDASTSVTPNVSDSTQVALPRQDGESHRQTVQVLMQGSRRMTTTLKSWIADNLSGDSPTLGECQIPIEQIYELRFGSYATEAIDVPYADWTASLAPEPKMENGAANEPRTELVFGTTSPLIGTTPNSFTVEMLNGSEFTLEDARGKIVVLDFWATWCGPCVQSLPKMEQVVSEFPADQVVLLALNQEEDAKKIQSFLEAHQLDFPVALDSGRIGKQFQLEALPLTVIIDQTGKVAFIKVGNESRLEEKLKSAIDKLLGESIAKED